MPKPVKLFAPLIAAASLFGQALAQGEAPHFVSVDDPAMDASDRYSTSCGFIYDRPDWNAKKLSQVIEPCARMKYDRKLVVGSGRGIVQLLKDDAILGLHAGDKFEYRLKPGGEGECPIFLSQPKRTMDVECVWEPGFPTLAPAMYKLVKPAGPQQWFHVLDPKGQPVGWYIKGRHLFEVILVPEGAMEAPDLAVSSEFQAQIRDPDWRVRQKANAKLMDAVSWNNGTVVLNPKVAAAITALLGQEVAYQNDIFSKPDQVEHSDYIQSLLDCMRPDNDPESQKLLFDPKFLLMKIDARTKQEGDHGYQTLWAAYENAPQEFWAIYLKLECAESWSESQARDREAISIARLLNYYISSGIDKKLRLPVGGCSSSP